MASGGTLRPLIDSRPIDFGSDELLLFSDDYAQQKDLTSKRSEFTVKDLNDNRAGRPLTISYNQQEEFPRQDVLFSVDNCMKKYADNLIRNLEEISGRLSKLEVCCYKLERSVGELRADMLRREGEADTMLESLEKHVHEVQRSLQIIRDKQELTNAQKELTKLQLLQESVNSSLTQRSNKDAAAETLENKIQNENTGMPNLQLAITPPNQMSSSHPITAAHDQNLSHNDQNQSNVRNPPLQNRYTLNQASAYYTLHQPSPPLPPHQEQQYAPQRDKIQNPSIQTPLQPPPISQYQQHWPQQPPSQIQHLRLQIPPTYTPYAPYQPVNTESFRRSGTPMPAPYSAPQSIGYGGAGGFSSHPQSQSPASQNSFLPQPMFANSDHIGSSQYPPPPNMQGYNPVISVDSGSRASHPQSFQTNINTPSSQITRNHPYRDIIEKAVGMGYSRDHVVSVVKLFGETGQTLDFNAMLDELNAHGGPPGAWLR